jgi:putative membrane-bound dehydrogenase-like protein
MQKLTIPLLVVVFLFLLEMQNVGLNRCAAQTLAPVAKSAELYDSQPILSPMLPPSEVVAKAKLPPGFVMQAIASEPDVQQPIAMAWDAKGRLWVAENYTYSEASINVDKSLSDRIVILEDTDGDGTLDKRTVFWDEGKQLTSIEIGHQGVWVLAAPNLLFLSDENDDDVLDGPPKIILNGFDEGMRHNFVNGLRFGPDGWLYGRHGILGVSNVGFPEGSELQKLAIAEAANAADSKQQNVAPKSFGKTNFRGSAERKKIHCGVWRFNTRTYEVEWVCQGTTNPWGMDWDKHGNLFFINTVIGHLWHAIPNSHLQRMYGEDLDPYTYELLPHIADHVHWDEKGEDWKATRTGVVSPGTDAAGGGHAHSGMMIYQANQWPSEHQNKLFTLNFHGQRINQETLIRQGAGFVGKHGPDMVFWNDPWFRGIELASAPDGSVVVLDWSDQGECHENDGVHRHSGRIYRISYKTDKPGMAPKQADMRKMTSEQLLRLTNDPNVWQSRMARQVLIDATIDTTASSNGKTSSNSLSPAQIAKLKSDVLSTRSDSKEPDPLLPRLNALWLLNATDHLEPDTAIQLLRADEPEAMHAAVIRLIGDHGLSASNANESKIYDAMLDLVQNLAAWSDFTWHRSC